MRLCAVTSKETVGRGAETFLSGESRILLVSNWQAVGNSCVMGLSEYHGA